MRFYSFTNGLYMRPLQLGLQTAHAVSEMAMECSFHRVENEDLWSVYCEWAENHKTIIILNGGNHRSLVDIYWRLEPIGRALKLPTTIFYEDEASLNEAATVVGVIVPEMIYTIAEKVRTKVFILTEHYINGETLYFVNSKEPMDLNEDAAKYLNEKLTVEEKGLIDILNSCGLAN